MFTPWNRGDIGAFRASSPLAMGSAAAPGAGTGGACLRTRPTFRLSHGPRGPLGCFWFRLCRLL